MAKGICAFCGYEQEGVRHVVSPMRYLRNPIQKSAYFRSRADAGVIYQKKCFFSHLRLTAVGQGWKLPQSTLAGSEKVRPLLG